MVRKTKKKREFNQTLLGYQLEHYAPLEYRFILEASGDKNPAADLIEAVSYTSLNPFFRTHEFRAALMEYRNTGLYPARAIKPLASREMKCIRYKKKLIKQMKNSIKS